MGRPVRATVVSLPLTIAVAVTVLPLLTSSPVVLAVLLLVIAAGAWVLMDPLAPRVSAAAAAGLLVPTVAVAWGTGRLLVATPAARLGWMLGEEDNAHVVGVARELLAVGPDGAELAVQYGTSFAAPGVLLIRSGLLGDPTGDPRLDAVTAVTASATLLPFVVMLALLLAAAAIGAATPSERSLPRLGVLLGALLAGAAVQLLAVALPLQLGFMTLAWAVAWVLTGWAAAIGLSVPGAPGRTRVALLVLLAAAAVLLEGSWPFLAGALLLPAAVAVAPGVLPWGRRRRSDSTARGAGTRGAVAVLAAALAAGALLAGSGAIRTVLGLGREAFTAGVEVGSSIVTVGPPLRAAAAIALAGVLLGLRRVRHAALVTAGAAVGSFASLAALALVALAVADGITGYGGSKLLLASVLLAVAGVVAVLAAGRLPWVESAVVVLAVALAFTDPLGRLALGWWGRTAPAEPPHAVAAITALERSSPSVPIRCRPNIGTPATADARLAAYFCVVWMEDAFNADRSSGNRFAFFQTEEPTFDRALAEADADGLYGFAYPLRLGPGWYGWDGTS